LITALEEISKIPRDIEKEHVAYLSLYLDSADMADRQIRQIRARIAEQRTVLVNLEGEKIKRTWSRQKAHVGKSGILMIDT
jgi:hypothetical protein